MNFCSKCVLNEHFPGISFDDNGVCNYCQKAHTPDEKMKSEYQKKFKDLIDKIKGKNSYDVIMAYSGGKDSTFTMQKLAENYGLNILAWTLDNGFISDEARKNITRMTDTMGATSIIVRPPFEKMKKAFKLATTEDLYNPKALDRASSICTTCIGLVKSMVLKTALQMEIPLVAYGWTPGQAPISSSIMQTNPRLQRFSHKSIRDPLLENCDAELSSYFLSDNDLEIDKERWPINIHPLAFLDYDENAILSEIQTIGWKKPNDTDPNSTNCLLNALANYLHIKRFSYHPYAWEIAGVVRSGYMHRDEGIEKTNQAEDMTMVKYAADMLEIEI